MISITKVFGKLTDGKLWSSDSVAFDTEIVGNEGRSVIYTHGSRDNGRYYPQFLAKVNGKTEDFYIIGCIAVKRWLIRGEL